MKKIIKDRLGIAANEVKNTEIRYPYLEKNDICEIIEEYIGPFNDVRIVCEDGRIVIERIEALSREDVEKIKKRLEALGYID